MTTAMFEVQPVRHWIADAMRLYLEPLTKLWNAGQAVLNPRIAKEKERQQFEVVLGLLLESYESRDGYRRGHSTHVQQYAWAIGQAMKLSPAEMQIAGKAALFHDIAFLLEKYTGAMAQTGRLSVVQWETIQQHPIDGAHLARTVGLDDETVSVIRSHHENWDGSGYPDRLHGDSIPLASRIIRFADTLDAMLHNRPYRAALTPDDVRAELIRCRGSQFDPDIVDALLTREVWRYVIDSVDYAILTSAAYIKIGQNDAEKETRPEISTKPASLRLLA